MGSIQEQKTNLESTANKSTENQSGVSNQALRPEILGHRVMRRHQGMGHVVIENAEVY